jgi:hypothetical protein
MSDILMKQTFVTYDNFFEMIEDIKNNIGYQNINPVEMYSKEFCIYFQSIDYKINYCCWNNGILNKFYFYENKPLDQAIDYYFRNMIIKEKYLNYFESEMSISELVEKVKMLMTFT